MGIIVISNLSTDQAALEDLGERLAAARLRQGMTQADLAAAAGLAHGTIERIEAGRTTQLANLIRCLRVLGLLANLDALLPSAGPTPIDLLEGRGKPRRRARRKAAAPAAKPFAWGDQT